MVPQKFRENILLSLLALFAFLIFAPVFFTQFGFHSDYSFFIVPPGKIKTFIQWKLFLESGRILGGRQKINESLEDAAHLDEGFTLT